MYSKKLIGWLYAVSVFFAIPALGCIALDLVDSSSLADPNVVRYSVYFVVGCAILSVPLFLWAWIGVMSNLSKGGQSTWFVLTLLLGFLMIFCYLAFGPDLSQRTQTPSGAGQFPAGSTYPYPDPMQAAPRELSVQEILQRRLARGEIGEQTYLRLRNLM